MSDSDIAEIVGCARQTVCRLRNGHVDPTKGLASRRAWLAMQKISVMRADEVRKDKTGIKVRVAREVILEIPD